MPLLVPDEPDISEVPVGLEDVPEEPVVPVEEEPPEVSGVTELPGVVVLLPLPVPESMPDPEVPGLWVPAPEVPVPDVPDSEVPEPEAPEGDVDGVVMLPEPDSWPPVEAPLPGWLPVPYSLPVALPEVPPPGVVLPPLLLEPGPASYGVVVPVPEVPDVPDVPDVPLVSGEDSEVPELPSDFSWPFDFECFLLFCMCCSLLEAPDCVLLCPDVISFARCSTSAAREGSVLSRTSPCVLVCDCDDCECAQPAASSNDESNTLTDLFMLISMLMVE